MNNLSLPIEAQFAHASFMANCQKMSAEQRLEMLEKLHLSYLGHREFIKMQARQSLGLDVVPIGELD
jgi:hypothetical protein